MSSFSSRIFLSSHSVPQRFRALRAAALIALTGCLGLAQAEPAPAGTVLLSAGPVHLQGDPLIPVTRGATIAPGQTIVTGEGGFAHIRMADGGLVAIRPLSTFQVEVFDYKQNQESDRVRYRLEEGVARAITGGVGEANKEAFRLNTPVAAVGVRGTDFVVATTPTASRVAINSGAVVVAALGEHCSAAGFGACSQGGVVLGKGSSTPGQFVEVVRGEQVPRLMQDPSQTPDHLTPPHPAEPAVSQVEQRRETRIIESVVPVELVEAPVDLPAPVQPEPIPSPPPPPPPAHTVTAPTDAHWGRWSHRVGVNETDITRVSDLLAQGKDIQVVNSYFGAGLEARATQLPRQGRVDFVAADGAAVLVRDEAISTLSVADGRLGVNFDQRTFSTEARFTNGERDYQTQAAGIINDAGYLRSDPALSNSQVTGALGQSLESAVTVVERRFDDGLLSGTVSWGRQ